MVLTKLAARQARKEEWHYDSITIFRGDYETS